ncbi:hypothetical protein ACXI9T_004202 [Bacillus paranthracis]
MDMMIGGRRACGKTTELIKKASANNLYIVCASKNRVMYVSDLAKKLDLDIPFPISVSELPLHGYMKEVLVDDAEDVLSALIGKRVVGASTSMELKSL